MDCCSQPLSLFYLMQVFPEARLSSIGIRTAVQRCSGNRSLEKPLTILALRFCSCYMALYIRSEVRIETRCRSGRVKTAELFETLLPIHSKKAECLSLWLSTRSLRAARS